MGDHPLKECAVLPLLFIVYISGSQPGHTPPHRTVARKSVVGGGLYILNFITPLIYSALYFYLGGLELVWRLSLPKPPVATGLPPQGASINFQGGASPHAF